MCAQTQTRDDRDTAAPAPRSGPATPSAPAAAPTPPAASEPATPRDPAVPIAGDEDMQFTGIEVCDKYLATYKACQTTIGVVDPALLDERMATLRTTWQEQARDPAQRDGLEAQCRNIADQMEEALDGRDCELPESDFVEPRE